MTSSLATAALNGPVDAFWANRQTEGDGTEMPKEKKVPGFWSSFSVLTSRPSTAEGSETFLI